jgi:DMSO/TMAO reductase YedYZ molybdopterin-dependent catalytic subunit
LITFVISSSFLGTVWGTEHSNAAATNILIDYEWILVTDGMVDQPLNLTLDQIIAMPGTKVSADLYCFDSLVSAGNWYGVRLAVLLEDSGLQDGVEYIQLIASDGYATFLDISTAMREDVIIAYELNGQFLPEILRLVIPNENGDKWIALITKISAVIVPVSVPGQPNLTPTTFREVIKPQITSSPQTSDESTQAINESTPPPVVSPSQEPDNLINQLQDFLSMRAAQTIEPDTTEPTSTEIEPPTSEPMTPEVTTTIEKPMITTKIAIIVAVAFACSIGIASFLALKKRKRFRFRK